MCKYANCVECAKCGFNVIECGLSQTPKCQLCANWE